MKWWTVVTLPLPEGQNPQADISEEHQKEWQWQLVCGALSLAILAALFCLGMVFLRRVRQAAKQKGTSCLEQYDVDVLGLPQVVVPAPLVQIVDADQAKKDEREEDDMSSQSTTDGNMSSEGSSTSVLRAASQEELAPELY